MSAASQVRSVMRNINLFVEEIPLVIFRLEEIIATLDISLSQSEFQFTFYNVASKIVEWSFIFNIRVSRHYFVVSNG